LSMLLHYLGKR